MEALKEITWTQYFIFIGLSMLAYYIYVFLRYFSPQVDQLFSSKAEAANFQEFQQAGQQESDSAEEEIFAPVDDELFERAQDLLTKLKGRINEAALAGADTRSIAEALRQEIKHYPELNIQAFRPGINYTILSECDRHGSVMLDEREVERLWTS